MAAVGTVNVARTQSAAFQVAKPIEHEQWMIAGTGVMAAPDDHLLLAIGRAHAGIHVKHDTSQRASAVHKVDPPAGAPTSNYTSVEATAGKPVQLTYHASARKTDCTTAPLATFDVLQAPKLGLLIARKGVLTTNKVAGCPGLKIPAQVAFYRARAGSAGPDHVIYKVRVPTARSRPTT